MSDGRGKEADFSQKGCTGNGARTYKVCVMHGEEEQALLTDTVFFLVE